MDTSLIARARYQVTAADLDMWIGRCPTCGGPEPRLTIAVDPVRLGSGNTPAANTEGVNGYKRYFREYPCSACELKALVAGLFPPLRPPPFEGAAEAELRRLRAELAPEPAPPAAEPVAGALFEPGAVFITPTVSLAIYRCLKGVPPSEAIAASPAWGYQGAHELLSRHLRGDFGMVGRIGDGDAEAGSDGTPLGSQIDRNAAAIKEGWGGVRSAYQLTRRERRKIGGDPGNPMTETVAERVEIGVRSELGAHTTLVGLVSEVQGQT